MAALTLYTINERLRELTALLYESGGELTPELESEYEDVLDMHQDKFADYIAVVQEANANGKAVKEEIKRLKRLEDGYTRTADTLKARMLGSMQDNDLDVIETDRGKVRRQRSGTRAVVVLVEPDELPPHFVKVSVTPNTAALKDALNAGDELAVRFAEFAPASEFVRIY